MTLASENKGMEAPAPAGGTLKDVKGSTEALQIAAGSTADEKENKSDGHGKTAGKTPAASLEDDQEMRQLANEALKSINGKSSGRGLVKSASSEILDHYNQQPLHVRSRAEQWELPRSEIHLTSKLGEGDGGVIYHAHWRGLDVVAKMLKTEGDKPSVVENAVAKADLINEISVLSRLRHPNLIMFLGACTVKEPLIILNEYLSGGNLEDYLLDKRKERGGKAWQPPPKLVLQWSMELARALCFLHNCNPIIIHRDLKPANLLLNEDGHLKVGDFGLSKVKDLQKVAGTYRMTGKTGSMRYMAPEVFQDNPHYDEKVDIYSCAMIFWFLCTGTRAFDRMTDVMAAHSACVAAVRPPISALPYRVRRG
mmetsp:Transcript_3699/g.7660  ORF Transcript_3699/g.7660 Transcript_3699/m.7660 type:complete len:367 (+) Transcript_3699:150-1250(+)